MKKVFSSEDVLTSNLFASMLKSKGFESRVQEMRGIYFPSKYDVFTDINTPEAEIEEVKNQIQVKSLPSADKTERSNLKKNKVFIAVLWFILIYTFFGLIYSFWDYLRQ